MLALISVKGNINRTLGRFIASSLDLRPILLLQDPTLRSPIEQFSPSGEIPFQYKLEIMPLPHPQEFRDSMKLILAKVEEMTLPAVNATHRPAIVFRPGSIYTPAEMYKWLTHNGRFGSDELDTFVAYDDHHVAMWAEPQKHFDAVLELGLM